MYSVCLGVAVNHEASDSHPEGVRCDTEPVAIRKVKALCVRACVRGASAGPGVSKRRRAVECMLVGAIVGYAVHAYATAHKVSTAPTAHHELPAPLVDKLTVLQNSATREVPLQPPTRASQDPSERGVGHGADHRADAVQMLLPIEGLQRGGGGGKVGGGGLEEHREPAAPFVGASRTASAAPFYPAKEPQASHPSLREESPKAPSHMQARPAHAQEALLQGLVRTKSHRQQYPALAGAQPVPVAQAAPAAPAVPAAIMEASTTANAHANANPVEADAPTTARWLRRVDTVVRCGKATPGNQKAVFLYHCRKAAGTTLRTYLQTMTQTRGTSFTRAQVRVACWILLAVLDRNSTRRLLCVPCARVCAFERDNATNPMGN